MSRNLIGAAHRIVAGVLLAFAFASAGRGADDVRSLMAQLDTQIRDKQYAEAEATCRRLIEAAPRSPTHPYNLACMLARQDKKAEALVALDKAVSLGFGEGDLMKADADLESLREEPKFKELLKKVEAAARPIPRETGPMVAGESNAWHRGAGSEPSQDRPVAPLPLPAAARDRSLTGVCFVDAMNGWLVGENGFCASTTDGGRTWKIAPTQCGAVFRGAAFRENGQGWICGDGDTNAPNRGLQHVVFPKDQLAGLLLGSADGGGTWRTNWVPTNFEIQTVGWNGRAGVIGTSGGGTHLDGDIFVFSLPRSMTLKSMYRAIFGVTPCGETGWIAVGAPVSVGFMPPPDSPLYTTRSCRAVFSADDAASWQPAEGSEAKAGGSLRGVAATSGSRALAVGDKGCILASSDAGHTWKTVSSGATEDLLAVAWGEGSRAAAVGRKGVVLVTADDGATWRRIDAGTPEDLRGVSAAGRRFVAAGGKGVCLRFEP